MVNLITPHFFAGRNNFSVVLWYKVYKTTGTPCSCWLCKGETYNRKEYKKEARRIIYESLD